MATKEVKCPNNSEAIPHLAKDTLIRRMALMPRSDQQRR
jgi:hypothetical protein